MPDPLVRARHLKLVLAAADRQPQRQLIRERLGPTRTADIESASGTDWLPIEHDVAMARALEAVLGQEGLATFNREMMQQSLHGPLLRTLVDLATHFIGRDPGAWASWIPRGWMLMFKGFGRWTVIRSGEREVTLTLDQLPPVCAADAVWPRSVASSLSGLLPGVGATGTVELERVDPAGGAIVYAMRWQAGAPAADGAAPGAPEPSSPTSTRSARDARRG
jgi:hypothetical protein